MRMHGDELDDVVRWAEPWRVHASERDSRREARTALLDAILLRASEEDDAAAIWRAVVAGRWSLVDHFDAGGRRFVVARRTAGSPPPRFEALTAGERRVLKYAARGHTNKFIAYELNVSPSAVGMRITRAARKLGVRSRVELIAAVLRQGLHVFGP
jgi:DNA-binding NarL/FixJ family response regulator